MVKLEQHKAQREHARKISEVQSRREKTKQFVRAKWCLASQPVDEGSVLSPGIHPKRGGVSTREMTVLMPPSPSKDIR